MAWFLVVVFFVNGEPVFLDGWHPLEYGEDRARCEAGAVKVREQLTYMGTIPEHTVKCVTEIPDLPEGQI